jgi:hypothetical protein
MSKHLFARSYQTYWVFFFVCYVLLSGTSPVAAAEPNGFIANDQLYDDISRLLTQRLSRNERFTALPNNINRIVLHPQRTPVFCIPWARAGNDYVTPAVQTYFRDHSSFKLVQGPDVLGLSEKEAVVATASGLYQITGTNEFETRQLNFPVGMQVHSAIPAANGWIFRGEGAVLAGLITNQQSRIDDPRNDALIFVDKEEEVIVLRPDHFSNAATNRNLVIVTRGTDGGTSRVAFSEPSQFNTAINGILRLTDERWLGIGQKLTILRGGSSLGPSPEEIQAMSKAMEGKDQRAILGALAQVTQYPEEQIEDLRKQIKSRFDALGDLFGGVDYLISRGFQYYEGRWIFCRRLLAQDGIHSAILDLTFYDKFPTQKRGIFRLNADGQLNLLAEYDVVPGPGAGPDSFETPQWQCLKTEKGEELFFWPRRGLAKAIDGKLDWFDTSEPFKILQNMLGCDQEGRIYFAALPKDSILDPVRSRYQSPLTNYWVYRPEAPLSPSPLRLLFPITGQPVMDSSNRVWFELAQFNVGKIDGTMQGTPPALKAAERFRSVAWKGLQNSNSSQVVNETFYTALVCFENHKVSQLFTNLAIDTQLFAGSHGALIGMRKSAGNAGAFIIDGSSLNIGSDMHELVRRNPELMLNVAPAKCCSAIGVVPQFVGLDFFDDSPAPFFCRSGDLLWVNQSGIVEAYRKGRPLGFDKLRTSLNCPASQMLGPLDMAGKPAMVLFRVSHSDKANVLFWVSEQTNNITIQPTEPLSLNGPAIATSDEDLFSAHRGPVFRPEFGKVYFGSGSGALEVSGPLAHRLIPNSGTPTLVTQKGDLIVECGSAGYRGFHTCSERGGQDIAPTFSRVLSVEAENKNGELVCLGPEGVVWLQRNSSGDYVAAKELLMSGIGLIRSYVGETEQELFLTVADGRYQSYLAVVQKP